MGMAANSSPATRGCAKDLAQKIGIYHLDFNINTVVNAITTLFTAITLLVPRYKMHGGTQTTNLALQNIQARTRMVMSYLFAQLLLSVRGRNSNNPENSSPGSLLVLGSANVDESLRGYCKQPILFFPLTMSMFSFAGSIFRFFLPLFFGTIKY